MTHPMFIWGCRQLLKKALGSPGLFLFPFSQYVMRWISTSATDFEGESKPGHCLKIADILMVADRKELVSQMEPMVLSDGYRGRGRLADLAIELAAKSAGFKRSLPESMLPTLADLVRSMNCYYSNLIEGRNTHPIEIERALKGDFSKDKAKRNLQLEAKAHIEVQKWIDAGGVLTQALSVASICEMHKRFYELLPDELCWVENPETQKRIKLVPGALRGDDIRVGQHIGISSGAIPRFMEYFERTYSKLGRADTILAGAATHHRLAWIHPFPDGNGRVMRLMSHAMMLESLDTGALWSGGSRPRPAVERVYGPPGKLRLTPEKCVGWSR